MYICEQHGSGHHCCEAPSAPYTNPETWEILVKWFVDKCSQGKPEESREWGREGRKPAKGALSSKIPQRLTLDQPLRGAQRLVGHSWIVLMRAVVIG